MSCIADQNQTIFRPRGQRLHVVESPQPDVPFGMGDDLLHAGRKVLETLDQPVTRGGPITVYTRWLVLDTFVMRRGLHRPSPNSWMSLSGTKAAMFIATL